MSLELKISKDRIRARIKDMAERLQSSWGEDLPLFVVLMDGAAPFAEQLLSHLPAAESIRIRAKSYKGTESTGDVQIWWTPEDKCRIFQRDVVILDDILDTGATLVTVADLLRRYGADDVSAAVLIERNRSGKHLRGLPPITNVGFRIGDPRYLVGFGMDHDGQHRELPNIYAISTVAPYAGPERRKGDRRALCNARYVGRRYGGYRHTYRGQDKRNPTNYGRRRGLNSDRRQKP